MNFIIRKDDVAVPGHKENRIVKKLVAGEIDKLIVRVDVDGGVLLNEPQEVDFSRRVVVPIPAAVVLEPCDADFAFDAELCVDSG